VKLLLDTNRLSDAGAVVDALEAAEAIYVPLIALGEIHSGSESGSPPPLRAYAHGAKRALRRAVGVGARYSIPGV